MAPSLFLVTELIQFIYVFRGLWASIFICNVIILIIDLIRGESCCLLVANLLLTINPPNIMPMNCLIITKKEIVISCKF